MTLEILTLAFTAATALVSGPRPVDQNHFLIHGEVMELQFTDVEEMTAPATQIIIYQEDEIYVAINTNEFGEYDFNLPINHNYTIVFGGEKYVNKIIEVNAHDLNQKKYGHNLELDMGLFEPCEGVDFTPLDEPVALFAFDDDANRMVPDIDYIQKKSKELYKIMKKVAKAQVN